MFKKFLKTMILIILTGLLFLFIYILYGILKQGYSWSEMDWNGDGHTSIGEFYKSIDIGKRELYINGGINCTEYFSLKDGTPIKFVCNDKNIKLNARSVMINGKEYIEYYNLKNGQVLKRKLIE